MAMQQAAAEQILHDVLQKYGSSACDTPQMLETLLRKHGRACLQEVNLMTAALRCGVVSYLRSDKSVDPDSLARMLALNASVPQAQADWAVEAWAAAIAQAPAGVATPKSREPAEASGGMSWWRVGIVLLLAALTGAFAILYFGH
jgi:hypothetical protein